MTFPLSSDINREPSSSEATPTIRLKTFLLIESGQVRKRKVLALRRLAIVERNKHNLIPAPGAAIPRPLLRDHARMPALNQMPLAEEIATLVTTIYKNVLILRSDVVRRSISSRWRRCLRIENS
jgi:hypothetical protein